MESTEKPKQEKTDRRVRKTKKQLRLALTTLMLEKDLNEITVSQLTALADLNRSTFYAHYQDIYDMVEQIETEIFQQFVELVQSRAPSAQLLTDIFSFLAENADLCAVFLGRHGNYQFVEKFKDVVKQHCLSYWNDRQTPLNAVQMDYFYAYVTSGCIGLIQKWLETGMQEAPQQLATMAETLIVQGGQVFFDAFQKGSAAQ